MDKHIVVWLEDIRAEAAFIVETLRDVNISDLASSKLHRNAIYYSLLSVGEALTRIRDAGFRDLVESQSKIIQLRNRLAHSYDAINIEDIYVISKKYVPILYEEVITLIERMDTTAIPPPIP